jgi:hypothetical protein
LANLTSNVGSWMQTVAAQWLMTSLTSSGVAVGAIQATNLPLLAIPAGVLGDPLDRKQPIITIWERRSDRRPPAGSARNGERCSGRANGSQVVLMRRRARSAAHL